MMRLEKITPGDRPGVGRSNARIVKASSNICEIPENRNTESKNVAAIRRVLSRNEYSLTFSGTEPGRFLAIYCLSLSSPRLQYRSSQLRYLIETAFSVAAEEALKDIPSEVIRWISWNFLIDRKGKRKEDQLYVRSCRYDSWKGV